jgi:hypothetical protein
MRWRNPRNSSRSNVSVRVTEVRRQKTGEGAELLVSLRLARAGDAASKLTIPVHFEIEGARSELSIEMDGPEYELKNHRIPLAHNQERGWGKVSIPADENLSDNDFWFAFDQPVPRRAIIVASDASAARPLELAASIAPDPALRASAEVIAVEQLPSVEWEKVALLLWQAPLPEGQSAKQVKAFIERGGVVILFAPRDPSQNEFLGARWTTWVDKGEEVPIETWRGDQDLLAHTQSGTALPVGQLQVRRYCGISGEMTPLATLRGGAPLVARVTTNAGGAYFCATTPAVGDSSLATNGVVLYVLVQRALAAGASVLENTRQLVAGDAAVGDPALWKRLGSADNAASTEYALHRGVYAYGDRLLAINRPNAEDGSAVLPGPRVAGLFRGLDFSRVDDRAGNLASLIHEVWRMFLVSMMVALLAEAALCLPKPARPVGGSA